MYFLLRVCIFLVISLTVFSNTQASDQHATRDEVFQFFWNIYRDSLPQSYLYIDVRYTWLEQYPQLHRSLQALIYKDLIRNVPVNIQPSRGMSLREFTTLSNKFVWVEIPFDRENTSQLTSDDFTALTRYIQQVVSSEIASINFQSHNLWTKWDIFFDIYETLKSEHYDAREFTRDQLILWAIRWLTESTWDTYTTYFPPTQSQNFFDWLDWEYEWIWAYVDMSEPWVFIIVTPMVWSPAEQAGLRGWDRVTHVDWVEITSDNSLQEIVSWIKWPKWSSVMLSVYRPTTQEELVLEVKRDRIVLTDVEHDQINTSTYYIQVKNFGEKVDVEFLDAMNSFESSWASRLILDFRNNPGGYLWKVLTILSHFIETWEPVALIRQWNFDLYHEAKDILKFDISNTELIILQNSWTASASEIFIGTMQDYFPDIITLWEKTFWKGSVQSLRQYYDWSTLRYTTARWYTGKLERAIDGVWITPSIELTDEHINGVDIILEAAIQ